MRRTRPLAWLALGLLGCFSSRLPAELEADPDVPPVSAEPASFVHGVDGPARISCVGSGYLGALGDGKDYSDAPDVRAPVRVVGF